jgi:hypothetical protein
MAQNNLIPLLYPMLFGLASVLSCARVVIFFQSEWSTEKLPSLPPGSQPLENASYLLL